MTPFYQDDAVTLYRGDCLEVLPELERVDHVITDPPYARDVYLRAGNVSDRSNSHHSSTGRKTVRLAKLAAGDIGAIDDLLFPSARLAGRLARRWVIVFSDVETIHVWRSALEAAGLRYARTGAWVKPDAMPQITGDRPGTGFEPATICHAAGAMRWNRGGKLAVWTHFTAKGAGRPDHPCPKPLPLMVDLVADFTDEGETILDPFAGSGTTGVAAKLNGRRAILIERDAAFCDVIARRLERTEPGQLFARERPKAAPLAFDEPAA